MAYFEAKMHQIRFRLGLCPRPCWKNIERFTDPLDGFQGPTSKGWGWEGKMRKGNERGRGKRRQGVSE